MNRNIWRDFIVQQNEDKSLLQPSLNGSKGKGVGIVSNPKVGASRQTRLSGTELHRLLVRLDKENKANS